MSKCCCIECFADEEIREIIKSKNMSGKCDFCKRSSEYVYYLDNNSELYQLFTEFISIYDHDHIGRINSDSLNNYLKRGWNIFNNSFSLEIIENLLKEICKDFLDVNPYYLNSKVFINVEKSHLEKNTIFLGNSLKDFSKEIKNNIRFHSQSFNSKLLKSFLDHTVEIITGKTVYYRARIANSKQGCSESNMGAPPRDKARGGRANPEGIPYLYLGDSEDTVIYETRAGMYDYVSIGEFVNKSELTIVNLSKIDKISPFRRGENRSEYLNHAINNNYLYQLSVEIAKPLRNYTRRLEYLPTQYICDYIKTLGYAGIKYKSTMYPDGYNLAIFDDSKFRCTKVKTYDINQIKYKYEDVDM